MTDATLIEIPDGFAIGYGQTRGLRDWWRKRPPTVVVRASSAVRLERIGLTLLVGLNGKGKTTFLKYLCGCLEDRPKVRLTTTYLPEELMFGDEMTSATIIESVLHGPYVAAAKAFAGRMMLDTKKPYGHLSKGNKQKLRLVLSFALAEQTKSDLLALDEPLSGLDFQLRSIVWGMMEQARSQRQVLVSLHPDRLKVKPDAVLGVSESGILFGYSPVPESWEDIERNLTEEKVAA